MLCSWSTNIVRVKSQYTGPACRKNGGLNHQQLNNWKHFAKNSTSLSALFLGTVEFQRFEEKVRKQGNQRTNCEAVFRVLG